MPGNWREKLSILICKYLLDGFEGTRQFESDGFSEKIYLFRSDYTIGLTTEWSHILLNQKLFEEDLKKAQRQIFLHEKGHVKSGTLLILLGMFPPMFFYVATPLIVFLGLYILVVSGFFDITVSVLTFSKALSYLYTLVLFYPLAVITSYILETNADLFSLRYMESEEYRAAKESFKDIQPLTKTRLLLIRLTHPSPEFVLKIQGTLKSLRAAL